MNGSTPLLILPPHSPRRLRQAPWPALLLALVLVAPMRAQISLPNDLTVLSLDELASVSISAASKHEQPLFETPSAVSVLLSDEIRRYGYSSVVDALRSVPGVQIAATDTARWSAGVRGFNGLTSTKLLVLVDGRNIYSPMYGSVSWYKANIPLEDLERVEVVRGPGSSVWGANAVNGIVSVVSKDARATQGTLVSVRESSLDGLQGYLRYGGKINEHTWYRTYIRKTDTRHGLGAGANHADMEETSTGIRIDQEFNDTLRLTWQTDYLAQHLYTTSVDAATGREQQATIALHELSLLGRLKWQGQSGQEVTVQTYFDYNDDNADSSSYRGFAGQVFGAAEDGRTFDLDLSHRVLLGRQDFVWGGGFRHNLIDVDNRGSQLFLRQPRLTQTRYNLFVQDDITVVNHQLRLTLGTKLEHHDIIGWQLLPTARLTFTPSPQQTWWTAVSRAVRSPSRVESDVRLPYASFPETETMPAVRIDLVGDGNLQEETLLAYEAGWRWAPTPRLSLDLAGYYNIYDDLRDLRPSTHFEVAPPTIVNDLTLINGTRARGYGTELTTQWRPHDRLRFAAAYTLQYLRPTTPVLFDVTRQDFFLPKHMWSVRGWAQLSRDFEASIAVHYVDAMADLHLAAYSRFDAQITWRPRPALEINLGIQNAFDPRHWEFGALSVVAPTEVPRNFYGRVQWRF